MDNPFFKNNGPFKFRDILSDLSLVSDQNNQDQNIIDIKDLQNSKSNEITFFHSKKYKTVANNTKASFCITTENLKNELPKKCTPIIVDNVLASTSIITAKFYPESIYDDFDSTVDDINKPKGSEKSEKEDGKGNLTQIPVTYGDLTRQVASIIRDNTENKIPSAPRIAVHVTGMEIDRERTADASYVSKVNIRERAYDSNNKEYNWFKYYIPI